MRDWTSASCLSDVTPMAPTGRMALGAPRQFRRRFDRLGAQRRSAGGERIRHGDHRHASRDRPDSDADAKSWRRRHPAAFVLTCFARIRGGPPRDRLGRCPDRPHGHAEPAGHLDRPRRVGFVRADRARDGRGARLVARGRADPARATRVAGPAGVSIRDRSRFPRGRHQHRQAPGRPDPPRRRAAHRVERGAVLPGDRP